MNWIEMGLRKISVRVRLILAFAVILAAVTGIMGIYATSVMSEKILMSAQEKLSSDLALGRHMIETEYPGDWRISNGKLYKGDTLMEENYGLIDKIGSLTGDTVTIFRGDTRVATNVMKDNQRQINTQVSEAVAEAVLKNGETYIGRAEVVGTWNETAYEPIKDKDEKIIGIWYVGVPATPYDNAVEHFRNAMIVYSLIGILIGFLVAFLIAFTVYKPLRRITDAVEVISEGDFTHKVPVRGKDEPGLLAAMVNTMLEKMAELIGKTKILAGEVGSATSQVAGLTEVSAGLVSRMNIRAEQMNNEAALQADLVGSSKVAITEMSAAIQQVAANSSDVSGSVADATLKAQEGEKHVDNAIKQMDVISKTVHSTAGIIEGLGNQSQEIGQIVVLITDIANQTNLLALNAAIEAARAGEQGRGFAVVAEEVRKLAEEAGKAASRISDLIKEMQNGAVKAVHAMQDGTREVGNGIEVVADAGKAFKEIIAAVTAVNNQIQEMSAASEEMAASAESAITSVEQTAEVAHRNAVNAQDISRMAEEQMTGIEEVNTSVADLNRIVEELEAAIKFFKIESEGIETRNNLLNCI